MGVYESQLVGFQWFFGALFSVFVFFILLKEVYRDLKLNIVTPYTGLTLGYVFFLVVPVLILNIYGYYDKPVFRNVELIPDLNIETGFSATLYVCVCGLIVYLLHRVDGRKYKPVVVKKIGKGIFIKYLSVTAALYGALLLHDVVSSGLLSGGGHWYYSKQEAMANSSVSVLLLYLKHALRWILLAMLLHAFDKKYFSSISFYSLLIIYLIVSVYFSGNRFGIALAGISILVIYIKNKVYLPVLLSTAAAVPIAWFGTMFMWVRGVMHERNDGIIGVFQLMKELESQAELSASKMIINMVEGINFSVLSVILRDFPEKIDFLWGGTIIKPLVFWIPRSIWSDKPLRLSQILGNELAGDDQLSLVSTYIGEMWANFGLLSFFLMIVFLKIQIKLLVYVFGRYEFGWCVIFLYMFTAIRASFGGVVIEVFIALLFMLFVSFLVRIKFKRV